MRTDFRSFRRCVLTFATLVLAAALSPLLSAQNPELQQKIAEVKEASALNKQLLAQYTWMEQVTISLKGEEKKQEQYQVRLGPDGQQQKQSLDPSSQPQEGGRLKRRIVEKKTEEYEDYANQIKALIQQYIPPDKDRIQQAYQAGNVMLGPQPGMPGQYRLVISNYIQQGDNMTLVMDRTQKNLVSVNISTYLNDPKDAVSVSVQFAGIPGGPNHVASETINGESKHLTIAIQNSNYQHL